MTDAFSPLLRLTLAELDALPEHEKTARCEEMRDRHERRTERYSAEIIDLADVLDKARRRRLAAYGRVEDV